MRPFEYVRATSVADAIDHAEPNAKFVAGGTNLIDLMKADVMQPARLVDVTRLPMKSIENLPDGGLRLGALVSNSVTANDERVQQRFPLLSQAILAGASAQLRNIATNGGNLFQRTRCYYFYDTGTRCNKRKPGSGCDAIDGVNRIHAILGQSEHCIAVHPSDMCIALAALNAIVRVSGPEGEREVAFKDFHRLPGDKPQFDNTLEPDEIVTAIDLPANSYGNRVCYLKLRDRSSYAFALVSVAAALHIESGVIREGRIALGGVAHKPWRDEEAEKMLAGKAATAESFAPVADFIVRDAKGYKYNAFKIGMARRAIVRALTQAAGQEVA